MSCYYLLRPLYLALIQKARFQSWVIFRDFATDGLFQV